MRSIFQLNVCVLREMLRLAEQDRTSDPRPCPCNLTRAETIVSVQTPRWPLSSFLQGSDFHHTFGF